jgi:uncharacterized RDD family membrane protein YckC
MKLTEIRWLVGAFYLAGLIVSFVVTEPMTFGFSLESVNGEYRVAGGTHPVALGFSAVAIAIYFLLMTSERSCGVKPLSGVFRRVVAFWLDFMLAMFVIGPVLGILPTLMEWRRTGTFHWTFERNYSAPGDGAQVTFVVLLAFVALFFYYVVPLLRQRPTPGKCLMGYQVIADDPDSLTLKGMIKRTLLGFMGGYMAWFVGRDRKNGKLWLDKNFGTRAVLIE